MPLRILRALALAGLSSSLLAGCGGGGSGDESSGFADTGSGSGSVAPTYIAGAFPAQSTLANRCAQPRSGTDPLTGRTYPDVMGTAMHEKMWLRSWTHDYYLWYTEVPDVDPATYSVPDYFEILKTSSATSTGNAKDRFHFTYATDDWIALSQAGVSAGYGAQWALLASKPPRRVVIAYTEPNSPATSLSPALVRGTEVVRVDGVDLVNGNAQSDVDTLNAGLFPERIGESHTFGVRLPGESQIRTVTLTSASVASTPVQHVETLDVGAARVGYLLFNDHIATAERGLADAITSLRDRGVTDLVLDIRYNGGGYLDIASELAYMIAGNARASGRTFEQLQFNDKNPTTNPVTGEVLAPLPFHAVTQGFVGASGQALPSLDLARVFVLTSAETCSASESIINSLRGVDVEVIQIGTATCGKPYGFYPEDNCGTTYFSIQFRGVNAKSFGDYSDGFAPGVGNGPSAPGLPGCLVNDDFAHELGSAQESLLAAALHYRAGNGCPTISGSGKPSPESGIREPISVPKTPWLENRILRRPSPDT